MKQLKEANPRNKIYALFLWLSVGILLGINAAMVFIPLILPVCVGR
jgi:hypothetical protein